MLFVTLRSMIDEGKTVIFISHKLHEVKAVADRVTVLRGGRTVATVDASPSTPRSLAALMVGREVDIHRGRMRESAPGEEIVLAVEGVTVPDDRGGNALRDVSSEIRAGEILGVAGVAGNGQRELAEAISGMRAHSTGTIRVGGHRLRRATRGQAIAARVAHVPEDRLGTGVAPSLSIARNIAFKTYRSRPRRVGRFSCSETSAAAGS